MKFCDIDFGTESTWLDGTVDVVHWHDGDQISYTARRLDVDKWAVYFAMDLKNGNVFWSHGVDLLGVAPKVLKPKDTSILNKVFEAHKQGLTEWSGIMEIAALEFEGQERLI